MSNLKEYYNARKEKDMNFFFGESNWRKTSNQYFQFKRVLDDDNMIIVTNNVKTIKGNYVLLVDNNKVVYLKNWQVKEVENYFDGVYGYAVKLNRNYFKPYTFSFEFDGYSFEKEETFDDLMNVAKEQQEENMAIKLSKVERGF